MNIAAILAGGKGTRMGGNVPKQFLEIGGVPVIILTARKFQEHPEIDGILFVCTAEHTGYLKKLTEEYSITKTIGVIPGGKDRAESSFLAVSRLALNYPRDTIVLIHDAARPNVDGRIISDNIREASRLGACNTVIPSQDTILRSADGSMVSGYTDRREMYLVQTPQSFSLGTIYDAHMACFGRLGITDDCGMVFACGCPVGLVEGSKANIKITTAEDMEMAALLGKISGK